MKVLKAFLESFRIKSITIAVYIWIFNTSLSLLVYFIIFYLFSLSEGSTFFSENFSNQNPLLSLIEIFQNNQSISIIFFNFVILGLVLFIPASIFISGAVLSIFITQEEINFRNLLNSSVENFTKILKIFFINILNWILVIFFSGLILFILWHIQKTSGNESLVSILIYIWIFITIFLFIFSFAIYDYSRIIRLKTGRNFLFSFQKGIKFVFSNKIIILSLFVIYIITIIVFHILSSILLSKIENMLHLLFLIIIYQVLILLKSYIKTMMMNAEVNIYMSSLTKFGSLD